MSPHAPAGPASSLASHEVFLEAWIDWTSADGLRTPAPAKFLGGEQELPAGGTACVHLLPRPGRYAWISEVPRPGSKGLLKRFTLP